MYRGIGIIFKDSSDYDACQRMLLNMRRARLIDFEDITDLTRERILAATWDNVPEYAETVARIYRKNLWQDQPEVVVIFIEKQAMEGVVRPVTDDYGVELIPIRGQASETPCWNIAQDWSEVDKPIKVYYLGDHDPAGLLIEQSLQERIRGYCGHWNVEWQRLAVTRQDFDNPELLGFAVKRNPKQPNGPWARYLAEYGDRCVEADAISMNEIRRRVEQPILSHIDQAKWDRLQALEEGEKRQIREILSGLRENGWRIRCVL
jgi:hypothetical protein